MDVLDQLSAHRELCLDVGGEVFLEKRAKYPISFSREAARSFDEFTNLCQSCVFVCHELVACFLVRITQPYLDILFVKCVENGAGEERGGGGG